MTTVLDRVVAELRSSDAPVRLRDLAARLDVEQSALRGMVEVLIHTGVLADLDRNTDQGDMACAGTACGTTCVGLADCPFLARMPISWSGA